MSRQLVTMQRVGLVLAGLCLASGIRAEAWTGVPVAPGIRISRDLKTATTPISTYLYDVAMEYARARKYDEAVDQLRKCLLINPGHPGAREQLLLLSRRQALKEVVAEATLNCLTEILEQLTPGRPSDRELRLIEARRQALREVIMEDRLDRLSESPQPAP